MAFTWKGHKDIWKGEGIYHLTFVVAGRRPLLGEIEGGVPTVEWYAGNDAPLPANASVEDQAKMAWVELTPYGKAVDDDLRHFQDKHPGMMICARVIILHCWAVTMQRGCFWAWGCDKEIQNGLYACIIGLSVSL